VSVEVRIEKRGPPGGKARVAGNTLSSGCAPDPTRTARTS
jgi:hypothetical protein